MKGAARLILAAGLTSSAAVARAEEPPPFEITSNLSLATDYVWRGVSQTGAAPALQGGFDVTHRGGAYLGVWGSNVDFGAASPDTDLELDVYGGFATELGGSWALDVGVLGYLYPESAFSPSWVELYLRGRFRALRVSVNHSTDVFGSGRAGTYYTAGVSIGLPGAIGLALDAGHYRFDREVHGPGNPASYTTWSGALQRPLAGIELLLAYHGSSGSASHLYGDAGGDRVVVSVSRRF